MSDTQKLQVSQRSKLRRLPKRGSQERELIYSILDEALIAHVGFVVDNQPFVIPMAYGRKCDRLYLHGSSVSRLMKTLKDGVDVCFTVTLLDGLVIVFPVLKNLKPLVFYLFLLKKVRRNYVLAHHQMMRKIMHYQFGQENYPSKLPQVFLSPIPSWLLIFQFLKI